MTSGAVSQSLNNIGQAPSEDPYICGCQATTTVHGRLSIYDLYFITLRSVHLFLSATCLASVSCWLAIVRY